MSDTITGRARYLGPADGLVHHKDDKTPVTWTGQAELYLLNPPLRGYTTVVVASNDNSDHPPAFGVETNIYGLEGEGLLLEWDDVGGGRGIATIADALTDSGYHVL